MRRLLGLSALALAIASPALAQDKTVTIGVSIPAADHGWTGGVVWQTEQAKARFEKAYPGLKIILKTSPDATSQANALQDMTTQKIDALVILPQNSDELQDPIREVKKNGAFVTIVDRGLKDTSIQDLYVAGNNPELGRAAGEYMVKALGGKGDIVATRGIPTVVDDERNKAFDEAIKGSNIKLLDRQYANWNRDDAFRVMQDFLQKYKHIDAVWSADDDMSVGVLEAIKQSGRTDIKFVFGGGPMKEMVKRVMDGDPMIPVDIAYPDGMVATALNLTISHFYGSLPSDGRYILGAPVITHENAKDFYFPDSPF